jgi:hypothetical protein
MSIQSISSIRSISSITTPVCLHRANQIILSALVTMSTPVYLLELP